MVEEAGLEKTSGFGLQCFDNYTYIIPTITSAPSDTSLLTLCSNVSSGSLSDKLPPSSLINVRPETTQTYSTLSSVQTFSTSLVQFPIEDEDRQAPRSLLSRYSSYCCPYRACWIPAKGEDCCSRVVPEYEQGIGSIASAIRTRIRIFKKEKIESEMDEMCVVRSDQERWCWVDEYWDCIEREDRNAIE
ncbi:hypothetical protein K435DRAFT_851609 [Dendrothele bispora CBS 962.96]|uniref:Uncharacterized protein n=1 Tax=Dendrothele bispora (strain CBS 962.96) TaxID=1314807 RepID=A0A4S8ML98_DENBC|nr:hypothetical protein K435DRAFT_851609 [Dendrothele bispora CBS 962.96]